MPTLISFGPLLQLLGVRFRQRDLQLGNALVGSSSPSGR
jgi:hypothetical protein